MKATWDEVLAWRLRQQFLDREKSLPAETIVHRLCGIQSQVKSNTELAVAARSPSPKKDAVTKAVASKKLMRTWAMRGTLHTLTTRDAPAFLSVLASARTWEKGAWQKSFLTADQMVRLQDVVQEELDGALISRDDLVRAVEKRTGDPSIAEAVRSGWGAVLKPLAWQGLLCNGDDEEGVTFTNPASYLPDWPGLPAADEAARIAIPLYLAAYGPAGPEDFNRWIARGALKKAGVRQWFADLGDALTEVDVEGEKRWIRTEDADNLEAATRSTMTRLLPGFDQYILGVGTDDTTIIAAGHRGDVSRTSGWISPVVVHGGRVVGVWEADEHSVSVNLFPDSGTVPKDAIRAEVDHLGPLLPGTKRGNPLTIS
jgi:hypothetical protein